MGFHFDSKIPALNDIVDSKNSLNNQYIETKLLISRKVDSALFEPLTRKFLQVQDYGLRQNKRLYLPPVEASCEVQRKAILRKLISAKDHLEQLKSKNIAPSSKKVKDLDDFFLKIYIATENKRNPKLNLHFANSLDELHQLIKQTKNGTLRTIIYDENLEHYIAADILCKNEAVSIIIVDSLSPPDDEEEWHNSCIQDFSEELLSKLPASAKLSYLMTGVQCSNVGCHIFSLSFALKMQREQVIFLDWHNRHLANQVINSRLDITRGDGTQRPFINGLDILPASFIKGSNSIKPVKEWIIGHATEAQATVSKKKEQTLMEYHLAHRTQRTLNSFQGSVNIIYSTSREHKRLKFIERAMNYIKQAEPQEILNLYKEMGFRE